MAHRNRDVVSSFRLGFKRERPLSMFHAASPLETFFSFVEGAKISRCQSGCESADFQCPCEGNALKGQVGLPLHPLGSISHMQSTFRSCSFSVFPGLLLCPALPQCAKCERSYVHHLGGGGAGFRQIRVLFLRPPVVSLWASRLDPPVSRPWLRWCPNLCPGFSMLVGRCPGLCPGIPTVATLVSPLVSRLRAPARNGVPAGAQ